MKDSKKFECFFLNSRQKFSLKNLRGGGLYAILNKKEGRPMKRRFISFFAFFVLLSAFTSCSSTNYHFRIESSDTYYLMSESPLNILFSEDSVLKENEEGKIDVDFVFTSNSCNASINETDGKYYFSATDIGEATFYALNENIKSDNTLTIKTRYSNDDIGQNIQKVFNTTGGVVFGKRYDIGINPADAANYSFGEKEGVLTIDDDGMMSVIGLGQGKVTLTENSVQVFDGRFSVFNSILSTKIKEDLISQNIISTKSDIVTNDMLSHIKNLNLSGELVNDPECSLGLRLLSRLETLDLSDNSLKDASFLKELTNLKVLDLSNNLFTDISSVVDNEHLKTLNLSNNKIKDITQLQFLYEIIELDLSNNIIEDIAPLSNCYSLTKLNLNNNKLTNYKSPLSGLQELESLYIGYCGIPFVDIKELVYLPNLIELDISGSNPSLSIIGERLTKLEKLVLADCKLNSLSNSDTLTNLTNLTSLKYLDISNNRLSMEEWVNQNDGKPFLKGSDFTNLETLCLGGNDFDEIPDLTSFTTLKTIDLTNSYNLTDISSILTSPIPNVIIDYCNSIANEDLSDLIKGNSNLKKLSSIGAFSYLTKTIFEEILQEVTNGHIEWRFLEEEYVNQNSVNNYKRAVYFGLDDFLNDTTVLDDEINTRLVSFTGNNEIIISLVNSNEIREHYSFLLPKTIRSVQLYGSKYYTYDLSFSSEDRKESTLNFDLYDYKVIASKAPAFSNFIGSKTYINSCGGQNSVKGADGYTTREYVWEESDTKTTIESMIAVNCYDLEVAVKNNSTLEIRGGEGHEGQDGKDAGEPRSFRTGMDGVSGAYGILCNSLFILNGKGLTIIGGNGGNGGNGANSDLHEWGDCSGGHGGNGGDGACCIAYRESCVISSDIELIKGIGGRGGSGGSGWMWSGNGSNGSDGHTPNSPTIKIN